LVVWLLLLSLTTTVTAQDTSQVALVVSLNEGEVLTRCVEFEEEQISGYEVLSRAGLVLDTDIVGLGATVCRIEGTGCPPGDCFCECKGGGPCEYWSYWHVDDGEWGYSQAGSGIYQVSHGDIEGWVWGLGSPSEAPSPPEITFEEVCTAETAVVEVAQPPASALATGEADATVSDSESDPANPVDAPLAGSPSANGDQTASAARWPVYALGGVLFIGIGLAMVRRRGKRVE
jgi:hypothetical protein